MLSRHFSRLNDSRLFALATALLISVPPGLVKADNTLKSQEMMGAQAEAPKLGFKRTMPTKASVCEFMIAQLKMQQSILLNDVDHKSHIDSALASPISATDRGYNYVFKLSENRSYQFYVQELQSGKLYAIKHSTRIIPKPIADLLDPNKNELNTIILDGQMLVVSTDTNGFSAFLQVGEDGVKVLTPRGVNSQTGDLKYNGKTIKEKRWAFNLPSQELAHAGLPTTGKDGRAVLIHFYEGSLTDRWEQGHPTQSLNFKIISKGLNSFSIPYVSQNGRLLTVETGKSDLFAFNPEPGKFLAAHIDQTGHFKIYDLSDLRRISERSLTSYEEAEQALSKIPFTDIPLIGIDKKDKIKSITILRNKNTGSLHVEVRITPPTTRGGSKEQQLYTFELGKDSNQLGIKPARADEGYLRGPKSPFEVLNVQNSAPRPK